MDAGGAISVLMVTWNRWQMADRVLAALARQSTDRLAMHVVIIDNASTDGTRERLHERWGADRLVDNATHQAHEPRFRVNVLTPESTGNKHPWGSLTIIRNRANLGGCGGFNTGLAFTALVLNPAMARGVECVWLVDDDVDLPDNALECLLSTMRSDPSIGLVGSRTNDIAQRDTTIETTIYFDRARGMMCPEPPPHHPQRARYEQWIAPTGPDDPGGRIGKRDFRGVLDVDVASACSLLARWRAVVGDAEKPGVGFWDWRYFIYCDDADWSLRFAKAGWRVVLNLDAVVYHTPWLMKLTPQRLYYAQRNAAWMMQKVLPGPLLRRVTRRWMRSLLADAFRAATHRRLSHARIILSTIRDIIDVVPGKTAPEGPAKRDVAEVLSRLASEKGRAPRVLVQVPHAQALEWANALTVGQQDRAREGSGVQWTYLVSNSVPGFEHAPDASRLPEPAQVRVVIHGQRWLSKLKKQWVLLAARPDAVVVFDNTCVCPVAAPGLNLHVDSKSLPDAQAQVERERAIDRVKLAWSWLHAAGKAAGFSIRVRPRDAAQDKGGLYG